MKKYECARVKDYSEISNTIEKYQNNGWSLHTYQAAGLGFFPTGGVEHFLLFEKEY